MITEILKKITEIYRSILNRCNLLFNRRNPLFKKSPFMDGQTPLEILNPLKRNKFLTGPPARQTRLTSVGLAFSRAGQTATELAIFGSILIMIIGVLVGYSVAFDTLNKFRYVAFRQALNLARLGEAPSVAQDVNARIVMIEDRDMPNLNSPLGIMSRSVLSTSASAVQSRNLYKTADFCTDASNCNKNDLPRIHFIINGRDFRLTTASYKNASCRNDPCPINPASDPSDAAFLNPMMRFKTKVVKGTMPYEDRNLTIKCKGIDGRDNKVIPPYFNYSYSWAMCAMASDMCPYATWDPRTRYFSVPSLDIDCDKKEETIVGRRRDTICDTSCQDTPGCFCQGAAYINVYPNECGSAGCNVFYGGSSHSHNNCCNRLANCYRSYGSNPSYCYKRPGAYNSPPDCGPHSSSGDRDPLSCAICFRDCIRKAFDDDDASLTEDTIDEFMENQGIFNTFLIAMDYQEGEIDFTRDDFDFKRRNPPFARQGLIEETHSEYRVEPGTHMQKKENKDEIVTSTRVKRTDVITRIIQLNPKHTTPQDPTCSKPVNHREYCWYDVVRQTDNSNTVGNCTAPAKSKKTCFEPGRWGDENRPPKLYVRSRLTKDKTTTWETPKDPHCGDGKCEAVFNEDYKNCLQDCPCSLFGMCKDLWDCTTRNNAACVIPAGENCGTCLYCDAAKDECVFSSNCPAAEVCDGFSYAAGCGQCRTCAELGKCAGEGDCPAAQECRGEDNTSHICGTCQEAPTDCTAGLRMLGQSCDNASQCCKGQPECNFQNIDHCAMPADCPNTGCHGRCEANTRTVGCGYVYNIAGGYDVQSCGSTYDCLGSVTHSQTGAGEGYVCKYGTSAFMSALCNKYGARNGFCCSDMCQWAPTEFEACKPEPPPDCECPQCYTAADCFGGEGEDCKFWGRRCKPSGEGSCGECFWPTEGCECYSDTDCETYAGPDYSCTGDWDTCGLCEYLPNTCTTKQDCLDKGYGDCKDGSCRGVPGCLAPGTVVGSCLVWSNVYGLYDPCCGGCSNAGQMMPGYCLD